MNKTHLILILIIAFLNIGWVGKNEKLPTIQTSASAKVVVKPDILIANFSQTKQSDSIKAPIQRIKSDINNFIKSLNAIGINDSNIHIQSLHIENQHRYSRKREEKKYRIQRKISVQITEVTLLEKIVSLAIECNINNFNGTTFKVSNRGELEKQALAKAIINGEKKAQSLAQAMGRKIKKVHCAAYNFQGEEDNMQYHGGRVGGGGAYNTFRVGDINIFAQVDLVFELR